MKYKKGFSVLMLLILLVASIFPQLPFGNSLLTAEKAKAASGADWIETGKDKYRTRMVNDSDLKPPIMYKASFDLGWSVSQAIAVGDYFYILASVPDNNNFFKLPRGTYLYRIPVDFKFQQGLSYYEQLADLTSKGANYVKISSSYIQSFSHPTYDPVGDKFYVGVGERIYVVDRSPFGLEGAYFDTNARLTGSPMMVGNDLFIIGTSTSDTNGGKVYLIKGLGTGNPSQVTFYKANISNVQSAEITSTTAITSTVFAMGLNYRDSVAEGLVRAFRAIDNGFGQKPQIVGYWSEAYVTNTGVAAHMTFYGGDLIAAAKYGTVYSFNAYTGSVNWTTSIPGVTLINNGAATDGTSIYIPVRRPGKIVKIRLSNGAIEWTAQQGRTKSGNKVDSDVKTGYDVGNDVTFWFAPNGQRIVFYGDTAGQLIFLDSNGNRVNVAIDKDGSGITRSSIKGSDVKSGQYWETQGTGLATELLLAKKHLVFGVNTTSTMGEIWFYSVGIIDDVYVASVQGGKYMTGQNVLTAVTIGSKQFSAGTRAPYVRLYVDGKLVGERRMSLQPGEEKVVYFPWIPEKAVKNGELLATINLNPSEFPETTFENNYKYANYSASGEDYINLCEPNEEHNMDIVKVETVCDLEGDCYTIYYYEFLTTTIGSAYPEKLRAGYGFEFKVNTLYIDETATYDGPDEVTTYFPSSPNYVSEEVDMERESVAPNGMTESAVWQLPKIYVEKYSGNVFYNKNDANHDPNDEFVVPSGERRWYTDFKTPDGPYLFKSVASKAGKNNLTDCYTYNGVEIKGSPFDDYVRRSVLPDTPFVDDEIGFNWQGKEDILGGLIDYYYNDSPNTGAISSYVLDPKVISDLKQTENEVLSKSKAHYFFTEFDID
jgi:hypothetical protein